MKATSANLPASPALGGFKGTKAAGENPLVPNRVLRQLVRLWLAQQTLAEAMAQAGQTSGAGSGACFAALAASLGRGDLVSEAGPGLGLLLDSAPGKAKVTMLPAMAVTTERLLMAVGAAVALKAGGKGPVLLVLSETGEMPLAAWKQMLGFVARLELPMLFAVLPGAVKGARQGELSAKSAARGVPGFPVDADDAVAMYRVVQESLGRLRAGEGPVLLEGVRWRAGQGAGDGLARLEAQLRARGLPVRGPAGS